MLAARSVAHFVALVSLTAGLAGCGEVVGQPGAVQPAHTQSFPTEPASPLPAGVDAMTGLQQRPMRPPSLAAHPGLAPNETCTASSTADLGALAPNYGAGVGPAYLSGQDCWCGRFSWGVTGNRRSLSRIFPRLIRQQGYP